MFSCQCLLVKYHEYNARDLCWNLRQRACSKTTSEEEGAEMMFRYICKRVEKEKIIYSDFFIVFDEDGFNSQNCNPWIIHRALQLKILPCTHTTLFQRPKRWDNAAWTLNNVVCVLGQCNTVTPRNLSPRTFYLSCSWEFYSLFWRACKRGADICWKTRVSFASRWITITKSTLQTSWTKTQPVLVNLKGFARRCIWKEIKWFHFFTFSEGIISPQIVYIYR